MKSIAVVLSGCGVYDGSEIYETVITLLSLDSHDANYQCFAPNVSQLHVINHLTGEVCENESRNVLVESARLARGEVKDLSELKADEFDGIIFPGGFGAAKNLSTYAVEGIDMAINDQVVEAAQAFEKSGKPAGFICIAPVLVAKIYGDDVVCTIGNDTETANTINKLGGQHQECTVDDIIVDETRNVVTTPAYMLAGRISEAAAGIEKLVQKVLELS